MMSWWIHLTPTAWYRYEKTTSFPHKIHQAAKAELSMLTDAEFDALCLQNDKVKALVEALRSISIMQTPDIMREVAKRALAPFKAAE